MNIINYLSEFASQQCKLYNSIYESSINYEFFAIKDNVVTKTNMSSNLQNADFAVIFVHYEYRVVTQDDYSYFVLFFDNKKDTIEDFVTINGWTLRYDEPITGMYRTYNWRSLTISKENLNMRLEGYRMPMKDNFKIIWEYFGLAQQCNTQKELDMLTKLYKNDTDIKQLNAEKLRLLHEKEGLEDLVKRYKDLLDKINDMCQGQFNNE